LTLVDVISYDAIAAEEYGRIRAKLQKQGTPIGALDTLIAAHAKALGVTLVTNNTRAFAHVDDLSLEDWLNP
jgi:tRNA(fMet)-specific endonuclease VapC